MLRHSVLHFPPNFGGMACRVAKLNAVFCLYTRAKKWKLNLNKSLFTSNGDRTNNRRVTVTPYAPGARRPQVEIQRKIIVMANVIVIQ